jgi:hypothetical protein
MDSCCICSEALTLQNVVNTECGHPTCKDCFWRWTKDKNTCAFCRKSLLCNDDELKEMQHMRGLLEHRTLIVRQVEEAYQEKDDLHRKKCKTKRAIIALNETLNSKKQLADNIRKDIGELKGIRRQITKSLGGTYCAFQHFRKRVEAREIIYRNERKRIDCASQNLAHGDKGMCMKVLKDIKCLREDKQYNAHIGRAIWNRGIYRVKRMNKVRKERKKFREERLREGLNFDLETLFGEETPPQFHWSHADDNIFQDYFWNYNDMLVLEDNLIRDFTQSEARWILERLDTTYLNNENTQIV